jgi:hypothetical protein
VPTLDERLMEEYPGEFEIARAWSDALGAREATEPLYSITRVRHIDDVTSPAVLGVGLSPIRRNETVAPAVLVRIGAPTIVQLWGSSDAPDFPGPHPPDNGWLREVLDDLGSVRALIAESVDVSPSLLNLIGLPAPHEQAGPGDSVHCGKLATLGARVQSASGARGILTAGHAAPRGAVVYDAEASPIGRVADSVSCATAAVPPRQPTPDVAIIEMTAEDSPGTAPAFAGLGIAGVWDEVTAYARTSAETSTLQCTGITFAGPSPEQASFGNVMQTAYGISQEGDSGAPVLNQNGEIVGHVVAGYPGVYSIVQDVNYQLQHFNASLR